MAKITVQNTEITVLSYNDKDYISLTDMANGKQSESRAADVIKNWIRTRYTIEACRVWHDCQAMARSQSRPQGQHPRLCHY